MAIVVVGNEKNFAALRPRLFGGEKVSSKAAGEVADAVRKANPHADLDKLAPGTVLRIPDSPHVKVRGEVSLDETTAGAVAGIAAHGKELLGEISQAAERRAAETREERAQVLKALDSIGGETRKAAGTQAGKPREPGLAKEVTAARKGIEEEDARENERLETLNQAREEWTAGLEALAARLR